jgi:hypothetical protein
MEALELHAYNQEIGSSEATSISKTLEALELQTQTDKLIVLELHT